VPKTTAAGPVYVKFQYIIEFGKKKRKQNYISQENFAFLIWSFFWG
jgi:hypothetical protein